MKIVQKAWNVFWVVDKNGVMIEAAIGGVNSGYVGEHGKEYASLKDLKFNFRIK